jgi:hypothetical protein
MELDGKSYSGKTSRGQEVRVDAVITASGFTILQPGK